jgi:hypothetical protein
MELVTHLHESLFENVEHAKRNRGKHMLLKKGSLCFMFLEKEKCGWRCANQVKNKRCQQVRKDPIYLLDTMTDMDIMNRMMDV